MKLIRNSYWLFAFVLPLCLLASCGGKGAKKTGTHGTVDTAPRKKVMVEVITKMGFSLNPQPLYAVAKAFSIERQNVTQWNNRLAVYAELSDPAKLVDAIKSEYAADTVKYFDAPVYKFDRSRCADTETVSEWTNVFLTANLVADPKMQQEYLNYHKTQFEKWPEVARGFCNAQFQQLLVFKNGRQLMLVISIPKGNTLDELNPLTMKDNPRVDEWNKLMSKYQEGLTGTKKGETWVFLTSPGAKQDGLGN